MTCKHKWCWAAILNTTRDEVAENAVKEINFLFYCSKCLAMKEKYYKAKNNNLKGSVEYETNKIINQDLIK